MKVKPLGSRIVVKRKLEEDRTSSGLYVPDTAKEKPQEGTVLAVGKGLVTDDGKVIPLEVKQKDRVLFGRFCGTEFEIDGEEYLIMKEEDVLGIFDQSMGI